MLTEKDYYDGYYVGIRRLSYVNILPCLIIRKEEYPPIGYRGWNIHIGILCFGIDFNW